MSGEHEDIILVCVRITAPLMLPDNRIGKCSECGWQVQFRPHAPAGRLMCAQCAGDLIDFKDPDIKVEISPRMLDDLLAYIKRQRN